MSEIETSDRGVQKKSSRLDSKKIGLALCGGIACVETIKIVREIRRHGASVTAFLTEQAERFVTPLTLEWATEAPVVSSTQAELPHLDSFSLVIVAPLTLNTLTKCALGIADNPVTLLVASQLGRKKPLLFVPTMNRQLYDHPRYCEYKEQLQSWGSVFLESRLEEDRLKMPEPELVAETVLQVLGSTLP